MAKFLTTVGVSYYVEDIIVHANEKLILVTPYLKLSQNIIERIKDSEIKGIKITLIYGKSQLAPQEKILLNSCENIQIYFCENLHAKCYCNESLMIITSMNLYEFSERNNREMGILIEEDKDQEIYKEALMEIESLKNKSTLEKDFNITKDNKIEKKIEKQATKNKEVKFEIHPNYNELHNFH